MIGWLWTGPGQAYHLDTAEADSAEIYSEPLLLEAQVRPLTVDAIRALVRHRSAERHGFEHQDADAPTHS